jgi:cyclase
MSKVRIIPTLLSDGSTLVKGEEFNSWRSVGISQAAARLFSNRDVDELLLLDVVATRENRSISLNTIEEFAEILAIPFSVGGGIANIEDARNCLKAGAEKIVIGTAAFIDPSLITKLADEFGSQSVVVSIDIAEGTGNQIAIRSGTEIREVRISEMLDNFHKIGVGELLLQSIKHDGKMSGMNLDAIKEICDQTNLPVIASSGAGAKEDFLDAIKCGASAVAAGAVFQFTELTPRLVRDYLQENGVSVRRA